jgi:O-acetyl-ADP-ribose deacetylase (regulator of RNase III)
MSRVTIDHHAIEIVHGDLTLQETEAIVNAANNHLWMGGGVAGAIKRTGGEEIERAAMEQGPIEVGAAVLTPAGALKAKFVVHAATMGQDLHTDAGKTGAATRSALALADERGIGSISFPALGTGVGGLSPFHCAKVMITEAIAFLMHAKHTALVRFVLFDQASYEAFEQELHLQFSSKRHPG